jgi:cellulose synthase (UDP-forming)
VAKNIAIYCLFWANVTGVFCGVWIVAFGISKQLTWPIFYCAWAFINASLLLSKKAIDHEADEVKYFTQKQGILEGAIRMPFGRSVVCQTINFPSFELTIKTPASIALNAGSTTQIVLYHHNHAYCLPIRVLKIDGLLCTVTVDQQASPEYQKLSDAVFARGSNWPQWLPHQNADKPFPAWVYRAYEIIPVKALDFMTNLTTFLRWDAFIQLWRK